ncbi:hypothetical protein [Couchioplanes caeruleus]|nr:hypothetical protein [Couchioplanes caeruleus]ROP28175.1 hypothetical protein EDD30_0888 [Couchioplanes caeruleus]
MPYDASPPTGKALGLGVVLGLAPHGLLALLIVLGASTTKGSERGVNAMWGFAEIFLLPVAAILIIVLFSLRTTRDWAAGILFGTMIGVLLVVGAMSAVDRP